MESEENFMILIEALKSVTTGLKEYTKHGLDDLYNRLKRKISSNVVCTKKCSTKVQDVKNWCLICEKWRRELEKYMRSSKFKNDIKWNSINVDFFSGPNSEKAKNELFRVFLRGIVPSDAKYDIQTMLSLFQNCTYFDVGSDIGLLTSIRKVRNYDFAHTEDFKLSNERLQKDINVLLRFFHQPSIYCCPSTPEILNKLKGLRKRDTRLIEKETYRFFCYIKENSTITEECLQTLTYPSHEQKSRQRYMTSIIHSINVVGLFVSLCFICGLSMLNYTHTGHAGFAVKESCIEMDYKEPFKLDFDFEFYRSQHGPLIGRKWLLNDLDYLMYSSERGVLLVAETGYGKSAIVSHLICQSDKRLPANLIYRRIISYHLCRQDSRRSSSPGLFVKSLAGSLSNQIPGFFDILKSNSFYEPYFKQDGCLKDPEGCFDFLIIRSLTQAKEIPRMQIVIIDAIDECMEHGGLNILKLLQTRIKKLPFSIKFLITTRNTTSVTSVLGSYLYLYALDSHSSRNTKDIKKVTHHKINELSRDQFFNLKTKFKTSNLTLMISLASNFSRNNMLYLTYAFEVWIQNDSLALTKTPSSYEDFFQYNLERVFGNSDGFDKVRGLFEVLCAAMEPISDREILHAANIPTENHIQMWKLFGNEMSHFISHVQGKMSIAHKILSRFLTDKKRKYEKFYVSWQNGNLKLAKYWISKVGQQMSFRNIDLIQLVMYVSESEDKLLRKGLIEYGKRYRKEFKNVFMLHHAAVSMNSYHGMVILIHIFGRDIEKRDYKGNFTAAYLASAFGNYRTLDALLEHGADINFVRLGPEIVKTSVDIEEFCKSFSHWEYSLLNIASQKGHLEVVTTLIEHGVNMSHTNSMGLNSFHLAAEYGHIQVVRHFLNHSKETFISSFDHALYLAARNGHYKVVELLLYHGARDKCVPCNASQYWTEFHQTRLQAIDNMDDLRNVNYIFKDDRRLIRCETALETSIQKGYDDVACLLISKFPNVLQCKESGGRTAVFTAIKYKRHELLKRILSISNITNSNRCSFLRNRWKTLDLNNDEFHNYIENQCPFNSTISQFSVMFGDFETYNILQNYTQLNWLEKDTDGVTPIHLAFCRGNTRILTLYENVFDSGLTKVRSKNGSTPLHSAAICKRHKLLSNFLGNHGDVYDNMKIGINHYLTISGVFKINTLRDNVKDIIIRGIFMKDSYQRIPLHYAAIHGNVEYLSWLIQLQLEDSLWTKMLHFTDAMGKNVIELAFTNIPLFDAKKLIYINIDCLHFNMINTNCVEYQNEMFNSHEKFIFVFLKNVINSRSFVINNYNDLLKLAVWKNSANLLGMLRFNFDVTTTKESIISYWDIIVSNNIINPLLFLFLPKMKYECSPNSTKILHKIFEDQKRTLWIFGLFSVEKHFFVDWTKMDTCLDSNGFNILHRAAMGGNFIAFDYLLRKNMSLYTLSTSKKTLLELVVENAPTIPEPRRDIVFTIHFDNLNKTIVFDFGKVQPLLYRYDAIAEIITLKTNLLDSIKEEFICDPQKRNLSFIHIVAAKGLTSIISKLSNRFDNNLLDCKNQNNISVSHLLYFFGYTIQPLLSNFKLNLKYPLNTDAMASLFLKFFSDFRMLVYPVNSVVRKCNSIMRNFRNDYQIHVCTDKMEAENYKLARQLFKWNGLKSKNDLIDEIVYRRFHKVFQEQDIQEKSQCFERKLHKMLKFQQHGQQNHTYLRHYRGLQFNFSEYNCSELKTVSLDNSMTCLKLIHKMHLSKSIALYEYHRLRIETFTIILELYENDIFLPFHEYDLDVAPQMSILIANLGFRISLQERGFHSAKKFDFWDVLRSSKNNSFSIMVRKISNSTVEDISSWRGAYRNKIGQYYKNVRTLGNTTYLQNIFKKFEDLNILPQP